MNILDKINIDFQVLDTNDPKVLLVADNSIWGYIEDKPAIIEIIVAGEKNPRIHYFEKKHLNNINSYHLGLSCPNDCGEIEFIDIPDGIYTITLKGSPDSFFKKRYYFKDTLTRIELDKLYIKVDLDCKERQHDLINIIKDVEFLLESAAAHVRHNLIQKAQSLFFKAQELIVKAKGCESCVTV